MTRDGDSTSDPGPAASTSGRRAGPGANASANPPTLTALTVAQAAKVLSAAGGRRITEDMLRADIDDGAPANADGTLNLVHYTAWLVREVPRGD